MSTKSKENLKIQKNPQCPTCSHAFGVNEFSQPCGPRLPLLLHCGHTFCEGCLGKLARSHRSALSCPICQAETSLKIEGSIKSLWPDIYMLGLIAANRKANSEKDVLGMLSVRLAAKPSSVGIKVQKEESCDECVDSTATCRCIKCEVLLCEGCFRKVHGASRTLRQHQAVPLTFVPLSTASSSSIPSVCVDHGNRPIEYYCETDDTPICSHCVILGPHKEHAITPMEEKNKKALMELQPAQLKAKEILRYLHCSQKIVQGVMPEVKQEFTEAVDKMKAHFLTLHATLQAREMVLVEKLESLYEGEIAPLEDMRSTLLQISSSLEAAVKEANHLLLASKITNDSQVVLSSLRAADNKPCIAQLVQTPQPVASLILPEELKTAIVKYGEIIGAPQKRVALCCIEDTPQDLLMSALQATPTDSSVELDISDSLSFSTDSETASQASSTTSHPNAKQRNKLQNRHKRQNYPVREELVYVTHIKHPCQFAVQRVAEFDRLKTLTRQMNKLCQQKDSRAPDTVDKDSLVLAKYARDSQWYRARVQYIDVSTIPAKITVYYVDYGNTEVVSIARLRIPPAKFLKLPEQALVCSMVDIVPSGGKADWSPESIQTFAKMAEDKPMLMNVLQQTENVLYVDLSKMALTEEIQDDRPMSVRDSLIFLEYAVFSAPQGAMRQDAQYVHLQKQREFLRPEPPKVKASLSVMLSHIVNPGTFYVQKISEEARYLQDMMKDLQEAYSRDTKDVLSICCPQRGMICVSRFASDDQWYRAMVVHLPGGQNVTIRYVDFGNTETVPYTRLKKLLDKFLILPAQAIECSLADIKPCDPRIGWEPQANELLSTLAAQSVTMKVLDVVEESRCLQVLLYDAKQKCINVELVDHGLATSTGLGSRGDSISDFGSVEAVTVLEKPTPVLQPPPGVKARDKPEHRKVLVSHVENPGAIYIQNTETDKDGLDDLMQQLHHMYTDSEVVSMVWEVGNHCAARYPNDGRWYRGLITAVHTADTGSTLYKVQMLDYGFSDSLSANDLRPLDERFHEQAACSLRCHLSGIQPAGDISRWARTSIDFLAGKIVNTQCYIVPKGEMDGVSLPVDLLLESFTAGDALSADRVEYHSVTQMLRDNGLALPKMRTILQRPPSPSANTTIKQHPGLSSTPDLKHQSNQIEQTAECPPQKTNFVPNIVEQAKHSHSSENSGDENTEDVDDVIVNSQSMESQSGSTLSDSSSQHHRGARPKEYATRQTVAGILEKKFKTPEKEIPEMAVNVEEIRKSEILAQDNIENMKHDSMGRGYNENNEEDPANEFEVTLTESKDDQSGLQSNTVLSGFAEEKEELVKSEASGKNSEDSQRLAEEVQCNVEMSQENVEASQGNEEMSQEKVEMNQRNVEVNEENLEVSQANVVEATGNSRQNEAAEQVTMKEGSPEFVCDEQAVDEFVQEEEKENGGNGDGVHVSPQKEVAKNYLPLQVPNDPRIHVVSSYVDYDGIIYVQEIKNDSCSLLLKECTLEVVIQDEYLRSLHLRRARIPRDGNCLFRCYAQGIFSDQSLQSNVRQQLCQKLERDWWQYKAYISSETGRDSYVGIMSQDAEYGGEPELHALSSLYGVITEVYQGGLVTPTVVREYGDRSASTGTVRLVYLANGHIDHGHYDLVLPEDNKNLFHIDHYYQEWRKQHVTSMKIEGDSILQQLMEHIQLKYTNSKGDSKALDMFKIGDPCVAQYTMDELFYRARIVDKTKSKAKVHFVDFGNSEEVDPECLRPALLVDIPIQCHKCELHAIKSSSLDGKWEVPALDELHQLVVGNPAFISPMIEPIYGCCPIQVKYELLLESGISLDVSHYLLQRGAAVMVEDVPQSTRDTAPVASTAGAVVTGGAVTGDRSDVPTTKPVRTTRCPYVPLTLVKEKKLRVCVCEVESPSHVYIQYMKQEDPDLAQINQQLDVLISIAEIINQEWPNCKNLLPVKPGMMCMGQFSTDECWYRAEVIAVEGSYAWLIFVDYGSAEWVHFSNIRALPASVPDLPAQARCCLLVGLEHCQFYNEDEVTQAMIHLVAQGNMLAVLRSDYSGELSDSSDEIPQITLYDEDQYKQHGEHTMVVYMDLLAAHIVDSNASPNSASLHSETAKTHTTPVAPDAQASESSLSSSVKLIGDDVDDADVVVEEELLEDDDDDDEDDEVSWAEQVQTSVPPQE